MAATLLSVIADRRSLISQIANIADRIFAWSQIADRNIARFSLCHFVLLVWHCDVPHRISAIGVSLGSPSSNALNAHDAMGSRVAPFQCIYALWASAPFSIAT